jgi:hypothetical protein
LFLFPKNKDSPLTKNAIPEKSGEMHFSGVKNAQNPSKVAKKR